MADRTTTFRFVTQGAETVGATFEKVSRQLLAEQAKFAKAQAAASKIASDPFSGAILKTDQAKQEKAMQQMADSEKKIRRITEDLNFQSEHTIYEYRQMMLKRGYDEALLRAKDGIQIRIGLEKSYAMDSANIAKQAAAAAGPGDWNLQKFGGLKTISRVIGMSAGDILGSQHGGKEIGMLTGGFLFGGYQTGFLVAAIELVGNAFRNYRESVNLANKANKEFTESLMKMSREWSGLSTSLVENTPFGKSMEQQYDASFEAIVKIYEKITEIKEKMPTKILDPFGWTAAQEALTKLGHEQALEAGGAAIANRWAEEEHRNKLLSERDERDEYRRFNIPKENGYLRDQMLLEREISVSRMKRNDQAFSTINQARVGAEQAELRAKLYREYANKTTLTPDRKDEAELNATLAEDRAKRAREAVEYVIDQERKKDHDAFDKDAQEREELKRQHEIVMQDLTVKATEENARATLEGYDLEEELQRIHFAESLRKAATYGEDAKALQQKINDDIVAVRNKDALGNLDREIQNNRWKLAVKDHMMSQAEANMYKKINETPSAQGGAGAKEMRQKIMEEVISEEELRESQPMRGGSFSTKYAMGYTNFAALQPEKKDPVVRLSEQMLAALIQIRDNGGLN